jgi:hypothetical protein
MRLESARSLKAELFAEPKTRAFATRQAFRKTRRMAAFPSTARQVMEPVALGITGSKKKFKLAIRVLGAAPWLESMIESMSQRAKGEVEVRYIGRVVKQRVWHRKRNRPLRIGGSIGDRHDLAGTLGGFVTRRSGWGDDMILSNNHVLANENSARAGDAVVQPGRLDGGRLASDKVGRLARFVRLKKTRTNTVDAALADLNDGMSYYHNWLETLGAISGVRTTPLEIDEIVYKVGRTTGVTKGRISAIEVDALVVGYDAGDLTFDDQVEVAPVGSKPFSLGGDSGSLIVDARRRAVALLFAGNDTSATYGNPVQTVLDALDVDLVY